MTADELQALGDELGLDAVGATPAQPYDETEQHIRERRERGLFGRMRFTMAQPEISCHPELLLDGAKTVISAALCYYVDGPEPRAGEGRLARYTWSDAYADLRERLDALGMRVGGRYRVLVDANEHVDREGAARSGVGFYGKNTLIITRRHGSWVVLGTVITDVEVEPSQPLDPGCGTCTRCIDACPTDALSEPGVLDATRCISYWLQTPDPIPEPVLEAIGDRVYGCDICQDVCPWNRGVERRRRGEQLPEGAQPTVSLLGWLEEEPAELLAQVGRLYVPRRDARWLKRNALVAAATSRTPELDERVRSVVDDPDPALADTARWAIGPR